MRSYLGVLLTNKKNLKSESYQGHPKNMHNSSEPDESAEYHQSQAIEKINTVNHTKDQPGLCEPESRLYGDRKPL